MDLRGKLRAVNITHGEASALLAKTLLPLMSAERDAHIDGAQSKIEDDKAYHTNCRPTRWMVLRAKLEALLRLQLSAVGRRDG